MKKMYLQSIAQSLIIIVTIVTLIQSNLNNFATTMLTLMLISLFLYRTYSRIQKMKANFDLFGDKQKYIKESTPIKISRKEKAILNGLNEYDMILFSDVTEELRIDILTIKKCMDKSKTIHRIMTKTGGGKALDVMFTSILNEPERLTEVNEFAYTNVPYLSKLIQLHVETEAQAFRNDRTTQLLEHSEETIQILAKDIVNDYLQYKDKDLDKLEAQIRQTTQIIDKNKRRKDN